MLDPLEQRLECLQQVSTPFFPAAMICNPNRISKTVTEVVQTEVRGWRLSHATTVGSGATCISVENTFVSRTIIADTLLVKCGRLYGVTAQFRDIACKPLSGKQSGDFGA